MTFGIFLVFHDFSRRGNPFFFKFHDFSRFSMTARTLLIPQSFSEAGPLWYVENRLFYDLQFQTNWGNVLNHSLSTANALPFSFMHIDERVWHAMSTATSKNTCYIQFGCLVL